MATCKSRKIDREEDQEGPYKEIEATEAILAAAGQYQKRILTKTEERYLGRKMELHRYLKDIENTCLKNGQKLNQIHIRKEIQRRLAGNMKTYNILTDMINPRVLRETIDGILDTGLISRIAEQMQSTPEVVGKSLVEISCLTQLIDADFDQVRKEGSGAFEYIIHNNMKLSIKWAKKFQNRGLEMADLIQEGNEGLMIGVNKWDHRRGFAISTYVSLWIRQRIQRAITDKAQIIRRPVHLQDGIRKIARAREKLVQQNGKRATISEIAQEAGISVDKTRNLMAVANQVPLSLETPIGTEDDVLSDTIQDESIPSPEEQTTINIYKNLIHEIIDELPKREREVINLRFGLKDGRYRTLDEVSKEIGRTRERVRQIEVKALKLIKYNPKTIHLQDYFARE